MARLLTVDGLVRLESLWRRQGAAIAARLEPGLSDSAIDAILTPIGIALPEEARVWWRWHNGAKDAIDYAFEVEIGDEVEILSLQQAVADRIEYESTFDFQWPATWLPFASAARGPIVIDCSGAPDDPAPAWRVDWEVGTTRGPDSIGDVVDIWCSLIESGAWKWRSGQGWGWDPDRLPEGLADGTVW